MSSELEDTLSPSGGCEGGDAAKAKALKRALCQLSGIRNAVPKYAAMYAQVLAAVRSLTSSDNDLSVAGSDSDLESPVPRETVPCDDTQEHQDNPGSVASSTSRVPGAMPGTEVADKYYTEESEEQTAVLAVAPVSAFLSVIGGFSLAKYDTSKKVWRRRKVKKEAEPMTPDEEQRMAKVEAAASVVLKRVHDELWSRWGEASLEQKELLGKHIRRGLRHLSAPNSAEKKLVAYLCQLGNDWSSMLAASRLSSQNIHNPI